MSNTRSRTPRQAAQRPNPPGYYAAPLEDLHDGKLFRVRDDETLFGFDLPWSEAFKLKDKIAGRKISTTVMTEESDDPDSPEWALEIEEKARVDSGVVPIAEEPVIDLRVHDNLEELRASAKRAAQGAAAQANARHASRPPAPKRALSQTGELLAATKPPRPTTTATAKLLGAAPARAPQPAPEPEPEPESDDPGIDPHDALDGLGDIPDDESIAAELAAMTDGTTDA